MADAAPIVCADCGAQNRVPLAKVAAGARPVCGKCKRPLSVNAPLSVTDATFASVGQSVLPVLVYAWAAWCGPCRVFSPIVSELAAEYAGRVLVAKLDVDANPVTAQQLGLRSIPTLLLYRNGREIERIVGAQPKAQVETRLERALGQER